ncbi:class I SAM-dependent methyltransferase [Pseudoteredinibacter isoporae]|uniref:Putative methyltransferase n=1 Tax=Pseudoteredinibacter isoporae TaxID=570281 RepID=A0A7X0JRU7_9GAMM|nr:class I SAM-dependent methyltransferase [Pseudoteredinibacter isoporae]MBB6521143.1 putative methyltransferase [Pseudoteredinibacter isoporae]NHO86704.1 class I SAM-dependent methyltransferase [Pseudoteredinibacter isoporae]NIB24844.1 class I SAM-dependent methyltransferase [Pseudoteredinibacter isoporae]
MFKYSARVLFLLMLLVATAQVSSADHTVVDTATLKAVQAAIQDPARIEKARERDPFRKPLEVLLFSEIKPNDSVLEITPGEGYYTALLSRVIGDKGVLYAVDPARAFEHLPQIREFFTDYQKKDFRKNIEYSVQKLDEIQLPEKVDQIWMVLYYHDTYWTGEDRAEMNRRLFDLLKPGGTLLLIDHHARPQDSDQFTRSLHRIHDSMVMTELTQSGFVLNSSSDILSNPNDPRTDSVFSPEWRGRTDRFVWRFKKYRSRVSDGASR